MLARLTVGFWSHTGQRLNPDATTTCHSRATEKLALASLCLRWPVFADLREAEVACIELLAPRRGLVSHGFNYSLLVYSFRQQIGEEVEHSFFPNDPSAG